MGNQSEGYLPLRVLRCSTGAFKAVFLAFLDTCISSYETRSAQSWFKVGIIYNKSPSYPMADCFGLRINATTSHFNYYSKFILSVTESESIVDYALPRRPVKEFIHRFAVYNDRAAIV